MPLQELKFWEESFKVYERGLALFKWPHVRDLWQTYLAQFVQRYKGSKLERARDLFRQAIESVSASIALALYHEANNRPFCVVYTCMQYSSRLQKHA